MSKIKSVVGLIGIILIFAIVAYIFYKIVGLTNIFYIIIIFPLWLLLGWYLTKREEKNKLDEG